MARKLHQYELTTNFVGPGDMPYPVYARNKKAAEKLVRRKLRRGERIILLERVYWPSKKERMRWAREHPPKEKW